MIPVDSNEDYYIGLAHTRGGPVDFANNWLMYPVLVLVRHDPSQAAPFQLVHVSDPVLTGYGVLDKEIIVNPCQIAAAEDEEGGHALYLSLTVGDKHNPVVRVRGVKEYVHGIVERDKQARGVVMKPVGFWQQAVQRSLELFTAQYLEGGVERERGGESGEEVERWRGGGEGWREDSGGEGRLFRTSQNSSFGSYHALPGSFIRCLAHLFVAMQCRESFGESREMCRDGCRKGTKGVCRIISGGHLSNRRRGVAHLSPP
jgi:hypothetical protein